MLRRDFEGLVEIESARTRRAVGGLAAGASKRNCASTCNPEGMRRSVLFPFSGLIAISLFVASCGGSKSGAGNPLLDAPRSKTMIGGPGTLALPPRCDVAAVGLGLEVCSSSELAVAYDQGKLSGRGDLRAVIRTPLTEAERRAGVGPGVLQVVGGPLAPDETVTISGRISSDASMTVWARSARSPDASIKQAFFRHLGLQRGARLTVRVLLLDGQLAIGIRHQTGRMQPPDLVYVPHGAASPLS